MDPTQMQTMILQGISITLATYEASQNKLSLKSGNNDDFPVSSRRNPISCLYKDFLAYQPPSFFGTEGVIGLSHLIELMEAVFCISFCDNNCHVNYATCTLMDSALA